MKMIYTLAAAALALSSAVIADEASKIAPTAATTQPAALPSATLPSATLPAASQTAAAQPTQTATAKPVKRVCKQVAKLNSRLGSQKFCLTPAEWRQQAQNNRDDLEKQQENKGNRGGS